MSDVKKRTTHVEARHGAQRKLLPVHQPLALPSSWEMEPGVPPTRAECYMAARPCPRLGCRHHLWVALASDRPGNPDAGSQGASELRPIGESCSLDVADRGRHSRQQVADMLEVTDKRIEQIEKSGLRKLQAAGVPLEELLAALADRDAA